MKKFKFQILFANLLAMLFLATSCQQEVEEVILSNDEQTIEANSSMAVLVERTSSNDGSYDNLVDGSSCFNLEFPYTVQVNGVEMTIANNDGLNALEETIDALMEDESISSSIQSVHELVDIIFPVTIVLADFSEISINSLEELKEYARECVEGGDDDDIECIDFVYPITVFTFDSNLTQTASTTIESDLQLRRMFKNLVPGTFAGFDFPISLELYDGTKVEVTSNAELAAAIEGAAEACDEDDDDDYNDDDFTEERLDTLLMTCPWLVNEVRRDGVDQSGQYFEYIMIFGTEQKVTVKDRAGNTVTGNWQTFMSDHGVVLKMDFDMLVDFNLEWYVYEIEYGKIKLHNGDGNRIRLFKACDIGVPTFDPENIRSILNDCNWVIKKVVKEGQEIPRLLGYEFDFMPDGLVTLSDGQTTTEGYWEVGLNMQGILVMNVTMLNEQGVSFEWPLREMVQERLKFETVGFELLLVRKCQDEDADDGDVTYIRDLFNDTEWIIALFSENGDDTTESYVNDTLYMGADGHLEIRNPNGVVLTTGRWFMFRNANGHLELIIRFEEGSNYQPLANDYLVIEVLENRIELKHENNGGGFDHLVLELKV